MMRIAIAGQQDFGKAVLEAFLARGDEVAGVFCAPEKPGARPDALKTAAQEKGVAVFQFQSLKADAAKNALKKLNAELGIMASFWHSPRRASSKFPNTGTTNYHPSRLPSTAGQRPTTCPSSGVPAKPA